MSRSEMKDYLETAYDLESYESLDRQLLAVRKIKSMTSLQKVSFLPILNELLLLDKNREVYRNQSSQNKAHIFIRECKNIIRSLFPEDIKENTSRSTSSNNSIFNDRGLRKCPLPNIVNNLDKISLEDVPISVASYLETYVQPKSGIKDTYLESDRYAPEILLLSLLYVAFKQEKTFLNEIDIGKLLSPALGGCFGMLSWQLALELYASRAENHRSLMKYFPKSNWKSIPCCIKTLLQHIIVYKAKKELKESSSISYAFMQESWNWTIFMNYYDSCQSSWLIGRGTQEDREIMSMYIWQMVCWDLAYEYDKNQCIESLASYWYTPTFANNGRYSHSLQSSGLLNKVQRLMILSSNTSASKPDSIANAVTTPWLYCNDYSHYSNYNRDSFDDFPYFIKPYVALRSFCAALLIRKAFIKNASIDLDHTMIINLCRTLINMGDAYDSESAKEQLKERVSTNVWSPTLKGLFSFAYECVQLLGKGVINPEVPENLIEILTRQKQYKNIELLKLQSGRSLLVGAKWASECLEATKDIHKIEENVWFKKDNTNTSGAEQICSLLLNRDYYMATSSKHIQLLMTQLFNDWLINAYDLREEHWMDSFNNESFQYVSEENPISLPEVLFAPELSVDEWNVVWDYISKDAFDIVTWIVILTRHLKSVIIAFCDESNNLIDKKVEQYAEQWCDEICSLNPKTIENNHIILGEFCNLLRAEMPTSTSKKAFPWIEDIFTIIIDVIFDNLSYDTYYYMGILLDVLSSITETYPFNSLIIQKILNCIIIHLYELNRNTMFSSSTIDYFLFSVSNRLKDNAFYNIRVSLQNHIIKNISYKYDGDVIEITPSEWNPLTDRFLQNNLDKMTIVRPPQSMTKDKGNNDVNNSYINDNYQSNSRQVGIISSVKDIKTARNDWGRPKEKEYTVQTPNNIYKIRKRYSIVDKKTEFEQGDIVSVTSYDLGKHDIYSLAWSSVNNNKTILLTDLCYHSANSHSNKKARVDFEFRMPNGQRVICPNCFNIDNHINIEKAGNYLKYWVPDIVGSLTDEVIFNEAKYEAVFDMALNAYVPIKRSFFRLLIEHFFLNDSESRIIKLVFIETEKVDDMLYDLFSASPGQNYLIERERWIENSLEEKLQTYSNPLGLCVLTKLIFTNGKLYLQPEYPNSYIEDNISFSEQFNYGDSLYAEYNKEERDYIKNIIIGEKTIPVRINLSNIKYAPYRNPTCNCVVKENGWNGYQQRCCALLCEAKRDYYLQKDAHTADSIKAIISLKTGSVVQLRKLLLQETKTGYYAGILDNGLTVFCAADSVTMSTRIPAALGENRTCIIENIRYHDFSTKEQYHEPVPIKIDEINHLDYVSGVVGKYASHSHDEEVIWTLWILNGEDEVIDISVPPSAFSVYPKNQGTFITGRKSPEGKWQFEASNKTYYIRALWQIEDHIKNTNQNASGILLAQNIFVPGKGMCIITQDENAPTLHLWNTMSTIENPNICGLESKDGKVCKKDYLYVDPLVFGYAKKRDIVCLKQNECSLWGISYQHDFDNASDEWDIEIQIKVPSTIQESNYYDVRRIFYLSPTVKKHLNNETIIDDQKRYDLWLQGDRHVFGKIEGQGIRLEDLKVPELISHSLITDKYVDYIPFINEDEISFVTLNKRYPYASEIRAVLEIVDNKWYASCIKVTPFELDTNLIIEFHAIDQQLISQHIYFAGVDDKQRFLFEWGYGFIFSVREEDLINENQKQIGSDLFFGDLIKEFSFVKSANGLHGWKIQITEGSIERHLAYYLWHDSFKNDVVQVLNITIDRINEKVEIHEISFVNYNANIESELNGWTFRKMRQVKLDDQSVHRLLLEEGGIIEERIILASLHEELKDKHFARPVFRYISLGDADLNPDILKGKTLCMEAQSIQRTGGGYNTPYPSNDYSLKLILPGNETFVSTVIRRNFSFDESKLRTLMSNNENDKYFGKMMLVTILSKSNYKNGHYWNGSIIGRIRRSVSGLKEWIRKEKSCLVVIGKVNEEKVPIEIAPGIICQIDRSSFPSNQQDSIEYGAITSLSFDKNAPAEERIVSKIVFPSDYDYFSEQGRAVELLPMDGAIKDYLQWHNRQHGSLDNQTELIQVLEKNSRHFSVAGFPQLTVFNPIELKEILMESIPRVRFIRRNVKRLIIDKNAQFNVAIIDIDETTNQPVIKYLSPSQKLTNSEWSQISFMDDTPSNIRVFAENGKWHYHDKETVVFNDKKKTFYKAALPEGNYRNIVTFPDNNGRLRYLNLQQIFLNGYSAREIREYGLPDSKQYYPVVAVKPTSIWIEIMPGRIVELPKDYLFIGESHISLANFNPYCFSCGDTICFDDSVESFSGGQRVLLIKDFRFGLRCFLGNKDNYIPIVKTSEETGLVLGTDSLQLTYPVNKPVLWYGETLALLDNMNKLHHMRKKPIYKKGDTIFLTNKIGNRIGICGDDSNYLLKVSSSENWRNAEWIYNIMKSRFLQKYLLNIINLPVVVDYVESSQTGTQTIHYSFSQRNIDNLPVKTIICGVCIGVLKTEKTDWRIIVKSGNAIIRIKYENFIRGIKNYKTMTLIVNSFVDSGCGIWLYKNNNGDWCSGLQHYVNEDTPKVELLFPVEKANGFVCQSVNSKQIFWLPAEKATRAGNLRINDIWQALQNRTIRNTKLLENGNVSIIDTTASIQNYSSLHKGTNYKYHLIPLLSLQNEDQSKKNTHQYLSELFPLGDIVILESEICIDIEDSREPIAVELSRKNYQYVVMVPYGTIRIKQHLPTWFNITLNDICISDSYKLIEFKNRTNKRYLQYCKLYRKGLWDGRNNTIDKDYLRIKQSELYDSYNSRTELRFKICYLSGLMSNNLIPELTIVVYKFAIEIVRQWLAEEGKFILQNSMSSIEQTGNFIDLLPVLSVIRIFHMIGSLEPVIFDSAGITEDIVISARALAVHLTRIVGLHADSSMHFEVLIRDWISNNKNLTRFWNCLNYLSMGGIRIDKTEDRSFAGNLLPSQIETIRAVCNHIQRLSYRNNLESLQLVGDCLLYSIGELKDYHRFMSIFHLSQKDYLTVRLARIGHLLTPAAYSRDPAIKHLTPEILQQIYDIQKNLVREEWPLVIMNEFNLPLKDNEIEAIQYSISQFLSAFNH